MAIHHYFIGSNTCRGFRGFFDELLAPEEQQCVYALKGGPGVGKSTLMRRVAAQWEQDGQDVDYYYCSGDPDSLDAVVSRGRAVLDGTAPHVLDPYLPGAAGGVVNLGVCLNEAALAPQRAEILLLSRRISALYARAYRYLAAAQAARADSAAIYAAAVDQGALCSLRVELLRRLTGAEGRVRRLYAQAITHKGEVHHAQSVPRPETVCLDLPFGFDTACVLRPLWMACEARGTGCLRFMDALSGEATAHIATEAFAVAAFAEPGRETRALPFDEALLARERGALAFNRASYRLHLGQAVECLHQAKELHDALERFYVDAMDYARWEELAAGVAERMRG